MRAMMCVVTMTILLSGCSTGAVDEPDTREHVLEGLPLPALLLWRQPYTEIVVEVDYVEGRRPFDETLSSFVAELAELADKPVTLVGPDPIEGLSAASFSHRSTEELIELHRQSFHSEADPETMVRDPRIFLHVLFPDGVVQDAAGGISMGQVLVVFKDGMPTELATDPLWGPRGERTVLRHELGHTLGLVNCGLPMLTPREGHRCHSTNPESVMHAGPARDPVGPTVDAIVHFAQHREMPERVFDDADLLDITSYRPFEPARRG